MGAMQSHSRVRECTFYQYTTLSSHTHTYFSSPLTFVFKITLLYHIIPQVTLSVLTALSCNLVTIDGSDMTYGFFYLGVDGECRTEVAFTTEDKNITAARTCLVVSMLAGFIAGCMVTVEWLFVEICCAGVLEGIG
jgi:hypothetical protein